MGSLTGQKIKDTYQSLLKVEDNGQITNVSKTITDGAGNASGLYLKDDGVVISGSLAISGSITINGGSIEGIDTGSFATTGSNEFVGIQTITGSDGVLKYSGNASDVNQDYPTLVEIHANNSTSWLERFHNDTFSTSSAVMAYFG